MTRRVSIVLLLICTGVIAAQESVRDLDDLWSLGQSEILGGFSTRVRGQTTDGLAMVLLAVNEPTFADFVVQIPGWSEYRDSVLTILDEERAVVAFDDDGGIDGASRAEAVDLTGGREYLVVVSASPNLPVYAGDAVVGFEASNPENNFQFALEITRRPAAAFGDFDPASGNLPGQLPVPDINEIAADFATIVGASRRHTVGEQMSRFSGVVAAGFDAFALEFERGGSVDLEVAVTNQLIGMQHVDDDSMLWVFDAEGRLIESDDDGGSGNASMITGLEVDGPGTILYVVVTTYPNRPELGLGRRFLSLAAGGGSHIEFDLVVQFE